MWRPANTNPIQIFFSIVCKQWLAIVVLKLADVSVLVDSALVTLVPLNVIFILNLSCQRLLNLILMYLLLLHISTVRRIESEERMVFLGRHLAKY